MLQSCIKTVLLAILGIVFLFLSLTIVFLYLNIEDCKLREQMRIIEQADCKVQAKRFEQSIICLEKNNHLLKRQS